MKRANRASAIAIAMMMAAAAPMAALAQAESVPMTQDVTESEIAAFAQAYQEVVAINAEYVPQVEQAADDATRQALMEEAQRAQAEAIETTEGISLDRYVEILTLAQNDADLTAQITAYLES
ncbi:DUF4168 domain-containing protein [Yoonia sp.]|uniref:DUF4168 domain-containing protein n=1 Tax=Yoonia sp. TaxID=2212373 RepID=UPI002E00EBD9|nr:DUF4168 domain-containing protein [Yoonia sp.]